MSDIFENISLKIDFTDVDIPEKQLAYAMPHLTFIGNFIDNENNRYEAICIRPRNVNRLLPLYVECFEKIDPNLFNSNKPKTLKTIHIGKLMSYIYGNQIHIIELIEQADAKSFYEKTPLEKIEDNCTIAFLRSD